VSTRLEDHEGAPKLQDRIVRAPGPDRVSVPAEGRTDLLRALDLLGAALKPVARPHIAVRKAEASCWNQPDCGTSSVGERVRFRGCPGLCGESGLQVRVDCHGPRPFEMRVHGGPVTVKRDDAEGQLNNFHLTIGQRTGPSRGAIGRNSGGARWATSLWRQAAHSVVSLAGSGGRMPDRAPHRTGGTGRLPTVQAPHASPIGGRCRSLQ